MYVHECACEHKCTHVFQCVPEVLYALVCGIHLKRLHLFVCVCVLMYACISVSICVYNMAIVCVVSGLHSCAYRSSLPQGVACQSSLLECRWQDAPILALEFPCWVNEL